MLYSWLQNVSMTSHNSDNIKHECCDTLAIDGALRQALLY